MSIILDDKIHEDNSYDLWGDGDSMDEIFLESQNNVNNTKEEEKESKGKKITFNVHAEFIGTVYYDAESGLEGCFNLIYERKKGRWYGDYIFIRDTITLEELSVKVVIGKDNKKYYVPINRNREDIIGRDEF